VVKRTRFSEYKDQYANYRFELSEEGILLMQCHTDGGSLVWDWKSHDDMADAFADIAGDREIKVLIHTGTGENYNADWGRLPNGELPEEPIYQLMPGERGLNKLDEKAWYARNLVMNVLDVDVPMISAVNGPCNIHSEVPLMGDVVLASEDAWFQDVSHFPRGQVPGDGQHVIWNFLVGHNRGRYLLLTGKKLTAQEALEWGAVAEVHPKDTLLDRAWELARARQAAATHAPLHAAAVHPGAEASLLERARPRPGPRDLRPTGVLPLRWWHGAVGPRVGRQAVVELIGPSNLGRG
jgi:enoyl-CoA hydratase/carnithine racemase